MLVLVIIYNWPEISSWVLQVCHMALCTMWHVCVSLCTHVRLHMYTDVHPHKGHLLLQTLTSLTNISHASTVCSCCYFRGSITSSCLCYMWLFFSVMSYRELAGWTALLPLLRASPWGDTRSIHTTRPIYCVFKWMGFHVKGVICIDCVLDICWIQPTAPDQ